MANEAQTRRLFERFAAASPVEQRVIREQVVTQHLALAAGAARRYATPDQYEDLLQVACCGLLEAFDRYDPTRSSFASFAWVTMIGLIRHHLRDHGWSVRPPRAVQEAANVLRRSWPELAQEVGGTPTTLDVAVHLGWTSDAVHAARTAELALHVASTDALLDVGAFDATGGAEQPTEWHQVETRLLLERVLQDLSSEERDLLRMRFVEEMSQTQIAALTGGTQMTVSRRLSRLMTKLRATID